MLPACKRPRAQQRILYWESSTEIIISHFGERLMVSPIPIDRLIDQRAGNFRQIYRSLLWAIIGTRSNALRASPRWTIIRVIPIVQIAAFTARSYALSRCAVPSPITSIRVSGLTHGQAARVASSSPTTPAPRRPPAFRTRSALAGCRPVSMLRSPPRTSAPCRPVRRKARCCRQDLINST